jgi:hypothetical protein
MLYCLALVALNIENNFEDRFRQFYVWTFCYLTLAVCVSPCFLLGSDWGRWIADINVCFLILWLSIAPNNLAKIGMNGIFRRLIGAVQLDKYNDRIRYISTCYASFVAQHRFAFGAMMLVFAMTFRLREFIGEAHDVYILSDGAYVIKHIIQYFTSL